MKETFDEKNPVGGPGFSIINNNIQHEYSPESTTNVKQQLDISQIINEAVLNLRQRGLNVNAHDLDLSGKLTRCGLIGKPDGNKDGSYLIHTDPPACAWFQNFVSGESGTFTISSGSSENNTMSDKERRALHDKIILDRQRREEARANKHAFAAIEASRLYDKASSDAGKVNQHAYATSKMVEFGPEVRLGYWEQRDPKKARNQEELEKSWPEDHCHNALIIPAFNRQGELVSLQAISPSGKKDFLTGGKIMGSFCTIGPSFLNAKTICVVEGYATGAAVHSATGLPVIVAFNAGNLIEVGQIVRKHAPEAEVVFCADDDQKPDKDENPGIRAATLAARAINGRLAKPAMGRKADFWDLWQAHGPEALKNAVEKASPVCFDDQTHRDGVCCSDDDHSSELETNQKPAGELFPRVTFPWQVLPAMIETCVKQLARSCATSPLPLPGLIFCMMGAAVGRKYCVSAKASWQEPSVTWYADIRESGSGKTPAMTALLDVFKELQDAENKRHKKAEAAYKRLSPEDKKEVDPPGRERRYYVDQITLEGLHAELVDHPTGGILASAHELSTMFNGQGEYKGGKGTDRERYLTLHDGKGGAITRKAETIDFAPAAVQFCGGVQPMVFAQLFSKNNGGTYLVDGTIFRFLLTYEPVSFIPLTGESWSEENKSHWDQTIINACEWADRSSSVAAVLSQEAQERFISWRNELGQQAITLPALFRGFMPKAWGYALRLAGILHLLECFSAGLEPAPVLSLRDIERGIITVEFYLGQAFEAIRLIVAPDQSSPTESSKESHLLARALNELRSDIGKRSGIRIFHGRA